MSASSQSTWADLNVKLKRKRDAQDTQTAMNHATDMRGELKRPRIEAAKTNFAGSLSEPHGCLSKLSLQDACNFQSSGLPSRFMFYDKGEWKDYSDVAVAVVCASFRARKSSVVLSVDGKRYLVNFVQMLQLNLLTGFLRSVAWIDDQNKCFFPSKFIEGHGTRLPSQIQGTSDHRLGTNVHCRGSVRGSGSYQDGLLRNFIGLQKSPVATASSENTSDLRFNGETLRNTEPPAVHVSHGFALLGDKLTTLDKCGQEFADVGDKFLAGLGVLASHTIITGIHRDSHTSTSGHTRLQVFKKQEEITRQARGDANVRHAWHGTSKQGVSGIVLHGFGQPRIPKNGAMYGVGVYLAPEDYSKFSAVYSDIDENGEQHMVLCQAILGNVEQVCPGSEQFHPSSDSYDTGVDDMSNPKRYIIWSTCMNTHIIPLYIVSFKLAPQWHGVISALRGKQSCKNSPVTRGHPLNGQSTAKLCTISKSGRISRDVLIKSVRAIAGDHILADFIKSMQSQGVGAAAWG